jgi:hypothetical protein
VDQLLTKLLEEVGGDYRICYVKVGFEEFLVSLGILDVIG